MFEVEEDDKNRLFETQQKTSRSLGQYLKILFIVAAGVVVVGAIFFYLSLPSAGDKVKPPDGLEDRIRDHLLTKEKRTATDITVFFCGAFYWALADVQTRPDIPGAPINQISRFRLTAIQSGADWNITAAPISGNDQPTPCS